MTNEATANTKPKRKAPPKAWKPGQSGNPNGRPRDGESWAAVLTWAANLTGEEAAKIVPPELAAEFRKLKGLQLKQAISLRVMAALLFDPSGALFNSVMNRVDGMPNQSITVSASDTLKKKLDELGLSLNDIRNDPLAVELFRQAGIVIAGADEAGSDSGGEAGE